MPSHLVEIQTETREGKRYVRWRCSCHRIGKWLLADHVAWLGRTSADRRARSGGARHVAAMERGPERKRGRGRSGP